VKSKIKELINYRKENNIHKWIFDTTRTDLFKFHGNEKLQKEISDWEQYKPFAEKYGYILRYPNDYLSIYILISLLNNNGLLCHPDTQEEDSSLNKMHLKTHEAEWIYATCIFYDKEYNYSIQYENFRESGFFRQFTFTNIYDNIKNYQAISKIYELTNSHEIHQAVICGGISDVSKCPNYFGFEAVHSKTDLLETLSGEDPPNLHEVLYNCRFMIFDYKGEDLGYARQLMLYSLHDLTDTLNDIVERFEDFHAQMKTNFQECENLLEYEKRTNALLRNYGR
jgi:hypothetical protein